MDLLDVLFNPLQISILSFSIALVCITIRLRKTAATAIAFGLIVLLLFSNPKFSQWLIRNLENEYPNKDIQSLPSVDLGVVLGSQLVNYPGRATTNRMLSELVNDSDRIHHAARLYKAGKVQRVLVTMVSENPQSDAQRTSSVKSLLVEWGIPKSAIVVDMRSGNTYENAVVVRDYIEESGSKREILLITSAYHMPRAMQTSHYFKFKAIPAPTDFLTNETPHALPTTHSLILSQLALHEYVGKWWYDFRYGNQ